MGSNSDLQEWWFPAPDPEFILREEELPSDEITVRFHANLTDSEYTNVQRALKSFDIYDTSRDVHLNVIHVTGYDRAVLEGQQVLRIFQKYDKQARRM